jgi:hypothetical protein
MPTERKKTMSKPPFAAFAVLLAFAAPVAAQEAPSPIPAEVAASIAAYDGKCPCPYTIKANGKPCAGSSAYSRPGGEQVLCFESDIAALQPCQFEDSMDCHWDAATQGNGKGRSFNAVGGQVIYVAEGN